MTTIVLASGKGGVGKTTLAMNLADGLSRRGSTLVVDTDPQQSALQWWSVADEGNRLRFRVEPGDNDTVDRIGALRQRHRYLVVDCPPSFAARQTRDAVSQADLLLVPMQPSPVDLWAGTHVVEWVSEAQAANPGLRARIVLNQVEPKTRLWKGVKEVMDELGVPALVTVVRRRAAFRNAALTGATVYAIGRRGEEAAGEIESLITEVLVP
jgi:chromosome partitioning protein